MPSVINMVILGLLLVIIIMLIVLLNKTSGFTNFDFGGSQRRDMIAAVPAYEEESLQQKVDRWTAPQVSNLTGSRDIPVFFQDYDVEANRKGTGAINTAREGFEGGRKENDLERALAGH